MSGANPFRDKPERRRRLRSIVWAAIGCTLLALLTVATIGGCVYLVSRFVGGS